ncbi:MAG: ribokinase [Candidatus Wolframiiraptor sp. EX4484-121]|nr:MAG: ribokinase [Candidatus Wolframiiraptor sp. EX4484-121]
MRPEIAVLGSIHMDYVISLDRMPRLGETLIGKEFKMTPGGKGANQAVAAARLGAEVYMIGKVGEDSIGDELIENLEKNGVRTDHIKRAKTHSGVALIFIDSSGNNVIGVAPGADDLGDRIKILLLQLEIPVEIVEYAIKKFSERDVRIILNPAPYHPLSREVLNKVFIATPNEVELELMSGSKTASDHDLIRAGRWTIKNLGIKNLVVTLGARGAMIITEREEKLIPAFKVKPIDTTGAGDAFNGALAVALSRGESLEAAVRYANAAGALSTLKVGAQEALPTSEEVEKFLRESGC